MCFSFEVNALTTHTRRSELNAWVDVLKRHVRAVGIRKYNVTLCSERGKEGKDGEGGPIAMSDRNESESESKNESDIEGRKKKQTWAAVEGTTNPSNNDSPTDGKKADGERAKTTNNGEETFKRSHSSDSGARKERQEKRNTPSKMLMTFLRTSLANLKEGSGDATNRLDRSPSSGGSSDEAASPLSGSPSSSGRRRSTLSLGRKSGSMYAPSRSAPLPAVEERQRSQSVARQEDHGGGTTGSATTSPGPPQRAAVKKEATRRKAKSEDDEWKNVFGAEKAKTTEAKNEEKKRNEGEKRKQKNEDDKSEAKETSDLAASKTQVVTSPRHRKKKEKEEEKEDTDSHTKPTKKNKKAKKENKN